MRGCIAGGAIQAQGWGLCIRMRCRCVGVHQLRIYLRIWNEYKAVRPCCALVPRSRGSCEACLRSRSCHLPHIRDFAESGLVIARAPESTCA